MKYGKETMRKDPVFRISPRRSENYPNPEEPEEDEDVQTERVKTANGLTTSSLHEKPVIMASCLHKEYKEKKKSCFSTRKKKRAVWNVSFCVDKAVLRAERPGEPSGGASGRAIHREGPRGAAARVVKCPSQ
ncbi:ATP-binding cassette sub-family A member 10-like [Balaenoptera musculus]|uniref:ATP-binding cassette sub-family A member 10-like n=1 Tax=Balaenoptera musculus TaxID=9771 RepID=A0A8B8W3D0_BALMU|nr:ATP-binding cassette sub-family A member 10-like [Balaenoptera musculus]